MLFVRTGQWALLCSLQPEMNNCPFGSPAVSHQRQAPANSKLLIKAHIIVEKKLYGWHYIGIPAFAANGATVASIEHRVGTFHALLLIAHRSNVWSV